MSAATCWTPFRNAFTNCRNRASACILSLSAPAPRQENNNKLANAGHHGRVTKGRRKSVFAEKYNPEEEGDEELPVIAKTAEQMKRLHQDVSNIFLLRSLDQENLKKVLDAMTERKTRPNEIVITQGDDGDHFYVVDRGVFDVFVANEEGEQEKIGTFDNHGCFGELALMYNMPRSATVLSTEEGILWSLDRKTFRQIVLKSAYRKRQEYERLLKTVPALRSLTHYERAQVADALCSLTFSDGDCIFMQDDEADGMYFVEEGRLNVIIKEKDGTSTVVSNLSRGMYFGELALVANKKRSASVYAITPVKLAFLDTGAFERLLGPCIELMKRNTARYSLRIPKALQESLSD